MAGWSDGLRWNAEALRASADAHRSHAGALGSSMHKIADASVESWEGAAATAAGARRRALTSQGEDLSALLGNASTAYDDAASQLTILRADMDATRSKALSDDFHITDGGRIDDLATGWRKLDPRWVWWEVRIWGSVQSLAFRLTAMDAVFAARLAVLAVRGQLNSWGTSLGDGILSGAQFLGDRVDDGLDWAKDRWEDLGDLTTLAAGTTVSHLTAFGQGIARFADAATQSPRWLQDLVLRGEVPEIAEVLASGVYLGGLGAGAMSNLVAGEDLQFFDDGKPFVGTPRRMPALDGRSLNDPSDLMQDMWDVYGTRDEPGAERPSVQITKVENPGQPPRYIVTIPGTTESLDTWDGWTGHPGGTDWAANLKGVGCGTTSSTQAIMEAIDQITAAHPGGQPEIILSGHSQGGIIAANIAADPGFSSRYNIGGIMTAGSPIQSVPIPRDIPVVNFNNQFDPVPKSDLGGRGGSRVQDNVADVPLCNGPGESGLTDWHGQETYDTKIHDIMQPGQSQWVRNEAPVHDFNNTIDRFYPTPDGRISTYQVEVGRE